MGKGMDAQKSTKKKATKQGKEKAPEGKSEPQTLFSEEEVPSVKDAEFVASKSGKKYYPLNSAQGKKIKEENRLYFKDEKAAKAAGFSA